MTETRDERVVRMAAAFPWAEYNSEKPVTYAKVVDTHFSELVDLSIMDDEPDTEMREARATIVAIVKLVNERPADPFDGIAP